MSTRNHEDRHYALFPMRVSGEPVGEERRFCGCFDGLFGLARVIYIRHTDAVKCHAMFLVLGVAALLFAARADEPTPTVQKQNTQDAPTPPPDAKGNELSLDIVATPGHPQEKEPTLFPESVFYVVLTNTSDKPIRIFEDWSSWGMFSISFEGKWPDGTTYKLERSRDVVFTRNFPAVFEVRPQGHYVFAIHFDKDKWPNLWYFHNNPQLGPLDLQAVFTENDKDGTNKVWEGTVKSEARRFKIFPS